MRSSSPRQGAVRRCALGREAGTGAGLRPAVRGAPRERAAATPTRSGLLGRAAAAFALCALLPLVALAQTPIGTPIDNQATATYDLGATTGLVRLSNLHTLIVSSLASGSQLDLMQYAPGAVGALTLAVPGSRCSASGLPAGPFNPIPPPTELDGTPIALPGPLDLLSAAVYVLGDPILLRVLDSDQNTDAALAETLQVRLTTPGDSELVELNETGPDTGVFTGHIQSSRAPPVANDCVLQGADNDTLRAQYTDPNDPSDSAGASAELSPTSLAFDSTSGGPIDGTSVTLIDDTTGLPALVFGDDGISVFPSTIVTGGTASDGVKTYVFGPGSYRFPYVPAGTYRLSIGPPVGYLVPSAFSDAALQTLPGAPFSLSPASRGLPFVLAVPGAVEVDLPLDLSTNQLFLAKTASTDAVGIGEFLSYNLRVRNPGTTAAPLGIEIVDTLPLGFRYRAGSARLDGLPTADPALSPDARTLTFTLPPTPLPALQNVRYVAEVTPSAQLGPATNRAVSLIIGGTESHEATATVVVSEDLFATGTFLMGQVAVGGCGEPLDPAQLGLAGARVYLEDGTYVVSDENGMFHFEGIHPGVHVVQLDIDSIPMRYEPVTCQQNVRFAGRSFSQFVDVQPGTLWRTDFRVAEKEPERGWVNTQLHAERAGELVRYRIEMIGSGVPVAELRVLTMLPEAARYQPGSSRLDGEALADPERSGQLLTHALGDPGRSWRHELEFEALSSERDPELITKSFAVARTPTSPARTPVAETRFQGRLRSSSGVKLVETVGLRPGAEEQPQVPAAPEPPPASADEESWLERASDALEWVSPQPGFAPEMPSLKIKVKISAAHQVKLYRNGEEVSALNLSGYALDSRRRVALFTWSGVDLEEGSNRFAAVAHDEAGLPLESVEYELHYPGPPVRAELVPERSRLVADGTRPPIVAVRLLDRFDKPARKGVTGEFEVKPPYRPHLEREPEESRQILGIEGERPSYEIGEDGIAAIELEPTTQTGKVRIRLHLAGDRDPEIQAWLEPEEREWVLVGVAQSTVAYRTLSGNMQTLDSLDVDEPGDLDQRLSLFAKGRIEGKWLLTLAYDSRAHSGREERSLYELIDPDEYYTLYGSTSEQRHEAPTGEKLYLKLERPQFYALFGDFDSGLEASELSRYDRSFTGLKSEYEGERVSYQAFAAETTHAFVRDEIRGDGTSGLYRLSRSDLVRNSETITIETRDRFRSELVIASQDLVRHADYNVDYERGTIYFRSPIASNDPSFNPIFIVAQYEADDDRDEAWTSGGRGALHLMDDRLELGATGLHEGNTGDEGGLVGTDLRFDLGPRARFEAEFAHTDSEQSGADLDGTAWRTELSAGGERFDARLYARKQETEFGLGQQSELLGGARKAGAEAYYRVDDRTVVSGQVYRETNLDTGADRDVLETRSDVDYQSFQLFGGYRYARDRDSSTERRSSQLLFGGRLRTLQERLDLRATAELSLGGDDDNPEFPTRVLLGGDYALSDDIAAFAEQEFAFGEAQDSRMTRIGLRATPWAGGAASTSVEDRLGPNGVRTVANLGLSQTLQLDDRWSLEGALDHVHTVRDPGNTPLLPNVPPSSGTLDDDFTALSLGTRYRALDWVFTGKIETRFGDHENKWGVYTGVVRELREGLATSLALEWFDSDSDLGVDRREGDLRFGLAYRPFHSRWIVLDRMDLITEREQGGTFDFENRKIVNNLHLNYQWSPELQISLQYGAKYVLDSFDGVDYDGFIDIWGLELRRDLGTHWDIGLRANLRNAWEAEVVESSYGAEIGYRLRTNMWVSLGYNFAGLRDDDFSAADYSHQGPYLRFRIKFDQQTVSELLERNER